MCSEKTRQKYAEKGWKWIGSRLFHKTEKGKELYLTPEQIRKL